MSKTYIWVLIAFMFFAAGLGQQLYKNNPEQNIYNTTDTRFNITTCYNELNNATGLDGFVCGITTTVQEFVKTAVEYGFYNPGLSFMTIGLIMLYGMLVYFTVIGIVIVYLFYIAIRNWRKQQQKETKK